MAQQLHCQSSSPTHPRTASLAMLAAVACLGAASGARAQVVISIDGECPGEVRFEWSGATRDKRMGILYASNRGSVVLGEPCFGTQIGLGSVRLQLVAVVRTGAMGTGAVSGRVPRLACGGFVQAVVVDGVPCTTSNVVQIPQ